MYTSTPIVPWHQADYGADSRIYSELRKPTTVEGVIELYSKWKEENVGIMRKRAIKIANRALIICIEKIESLLAENFEQFSIDTEQKVHDFYTDMRDELNKYGLTKLLKFYKIMMGHYLEKNELDRFLDYVEKIIALGQLSSQSTTYQALHTSLSISDYDGKAISLYGAILIHLTRGYLKTRQEKEKLEQLDKLKKAINIVRDWMEKISSRMHEKVKEYHCCMRELIAGAINYLPAGDHKSVNDLDCEIAEYLKLAGEQADQDIYSSLVEWSIAQAEYAIEQNDTQALARLQEKVRNLWQKGSDTRRGEGEAFHLAKQVVNFYISMMEYSAKQNHDKDIDLFATGKGRGLAFEKEAAEILEQFKKKPSRSEVWTSRVKSDENLGAIYAVEQKIFIVRAEILAEKMWETASIAESFRYYKQQLQDSLKKVEALYWQAVQRDPPIVTSSIIEQTLDFYVAMTERALNKKDPAYLEKFSTLFQTFAHITELLTTSSNKLENIIVENKRLKFEEFLQQYYKSTNNEAGLKDLTQQIEERRKRIQSLQSADDASLDARNPAARSIRLA